MSCINVFEQPFWNDFSLPALEPLLLVEVVMILSNNISMISTELTIIDPVTACTIAPGKLVTLWKTLCQDVRRRHARHLLLRSSLSHTTHNHVLRVAYS